MDAFFCITDDASKNALELHGSLGSILAEGTIGQGAKGIILGCTELPLLVKPEDSIVPLFDTTALHTMAAVDLALA